MWRDVNWVDWLEHVALVLLTSHNVVILIRSALLGQILDVRLILIAMEGKA